MAFNKTDRRFLTTEMWSIDQDIQNAYQSRKEKFEEEKKERESDLNWIESELAHYIKLYIIVTENIKNAKTIKEKEKEEQTLNFTKQNINKWATLKAKALENQK